MYLGLSTYTFPWHVEFLKNSLSDIFSLSSMLQVTYDKQIGYFQIGDNYPLHLLSECKLNEIRESAFHKKIQLQVGMRRLTIDNVAIYIAIAKKLGSKFLRIVVDDKDYEPSKEEVIRIIKQLLPLCKETGVVLAIENHDRFKAKVLAGIIEETDPEWVAICLDTANSLGAGEGIYEVAPLLLPYTINVHIKDFTIARVQHKMGFIVSGTAAGEGMLDIPWLIAECKKHQRCTTATVELWMNREETNAHTLTKETDWINKSITYLNNYIQ